MNKSRAGISVLLADDHPLFAEALRVRLIRERDLGRISIAYNAEQARAHVARDRPGVVVLDATLGEESGLSLAEYVRETAPGTRVIMLTEVESVSFVVAALRRGVRAWLPKTVEPAHLLRAIRGVARGEALVPPEMLGQVLTALVGRETQVPDPFASLTQREREVLQCLVDGMTRAEIARRLYVSTNTVRTHTQNLLAKLGLHSTLESVALALRHGFHSTLT